MHKLNTSNMLELDELDHAASSVTVIDANILSQAQSPSTNMGGSLCGRLICRSASAWNMEPMPI